MAPEVSPPAFRHCHTLKGLQIANRHIQLPSAIAADHELQGVHSSGSTVCWILVLGGRKLPKPVWNLLLSTGASLVSGRDLVIVPKLIHWLPSNLSGTTRQLTAETQSNFEALIWETFTEVQHKLLLTCSVLGAQERYWCSAEIW